MLFNVPVEKEANSSFESIETEPNNESANSSVMIEDLQSFIEEQHELSNVSETKKSAPFSSQTVSSSIWLQTNNILYHPRNDLINYKLN